MLANGDSLHQALRRHPEEGECRVVTRRTLGHPSLVEATVSISDDLFRKAEALAARRGLSVPQFFTELLSDQIAAAPAVELAPDNPPWMRGFGALSDHGALSDRGDH